MVAIARGNDKLFMVDWNGMYTVSTDQKSVTQFKSYIMQSYYASPNYDGTLMYYVESYGSNIIVRNIKSNSDFAFYTAPDSVVSMYFYDATTLYISISSGVLKVIVKSDGTFSKSSVFSSIEGK